MLTKILYWTPRIVCLLYIGFISLFALDVFNGEYNLAQTLVALTMHLIPSMLILLALVIAWRWELAGSIVFDVLAIAWLIYVGDFGKSLIITLPLFVISSLFVAGWAYRRKAKQA
mgnify:FL=1